MKIIPIIVLTLFMSGCANAQSTTTTAKLEISGMPLPAIKHVADMKISGDTLLFVFESPKKIFFEQIANFAVVS